MGAHPDHVDMDFLSSGGRAADGDVNSKSFEGMRVKRRQHRVGKLSAFDLTTGETRDMCWGVWCVHALVLFLCKISI